MINPEVFGKWMTAISQRFNRRFDDFTLDIYSDTFESKLSQEQFVNMCRHLFESDAEQFPTPQEFIKHARVLTPDTALPPAPTSHNCIAIDFPKTLEECMIEFSRRHPDASKGVAGNGW